MVTRGLWNLHINGILTSKYEVDSSVLTACFRQMVSPLSPSSSYQLSRGGSHTPENITDSRGAGQILRLGRGSFSEPTPFQLGLCLHRRSGCRIHNDIYMDKNRWDHTINFPSQTCGCLRSVGSITSLSTSESGQTSRAVPETDI